ncbi:MAG: AmmeMemoRadiSam system radical SAM enzyme [Thermodesulfobacteriota bacterium]
MKEALLYDKREDRQVHCRVCNHHCLIKEGRRGICGVRENRQGILYSLVYGKPIAAHVDPIEKKPLFHFLPGSQSFSLATAGCNFRCRFCQNADISQVRDLQEIPGKEVAPEEIVTAALKAHCRSISYTYTEPTIFFEYARDIALLAETRGLKNVFVSNGYMSREVLETLHPHLHAVNVDLKAFQDTFYKQQCGARLEPVLETLRIMKRLGIWVEVTTLIIPTLNDSKEELEALAKFIQEELGAETPWHISRFHPTFQLNDLPPTPVKTLQQAWEIGKAAGLRYVYTGNVPGDAAEKTYCHHCGHLLLDRFGFSVLKNNLKEGRCPQCGTTMEGFGQ